MFGQEGPSILQDGDDEAEGHASHGSPGTHWGGRSTQPPPLISSGYESCDSSDSEDLFLHGECLACQRIQPTQMRCVNRDTAAHGLPPCRGVWCPECYKGEEGIFHTIKDDGLALSMRDVDTHRPGWRCHRCELACMLGRPIDPDDRDWEADQLAMQYKIDSAHHVAVSTANKYDQAWRLLQRDIAMWQGAVLPYDEDCPRLPPRFPARQYALEVGMSMVKATSALYDKGRGPEGQSTFNHARARRTAFGHMTSRHPHVHDAVQKNQEFKDFVVGLPKRIGTMSTPAHPLHVETLKALIAAGGQQIRQHTRAGEHLLALQAMSHRLVLVYAFFLITRGNEPFRLKRKHWLDGIWLGDRAASRGVPEHIRFAFDFPTKTQQTSFKDGVLGSISASGVRIGAMTRQYQKALEAYEASGLPEWGGKDSRLFPDAHGLPWTCGGYLKVYLRPALERLKEQGHPHLQGIDISRRMDFWSIRRGANTWADADTPGIPQLEEGRKEEHVGWARPGAKRSRTSRGYSQRYLSERIKVTSVHM